MFDIIISETHIFYLLQKVVKIYDVCYRNQPFYMSKEELGVIDELDEKFISSYNSRNSSEFQQHNQESYYKTINEDAYKTSLLDYVKKSPKKSRIVISKKHICLPKNININNDMIDSFRKHKSSQKEMNRAISQNMRARSKLQKSHETEFKNNASPDSSEKSRNQK